MESFQIKIPLGSTAKDTITGMVGVCVARSEYLHGCVQICLKPVKLDKDGLPKKGQWFDEPQVERVPMKKKHKSTNDTGGPIKDSAPARSHS